MLDFARIVYNSALIAQILDTKPFLQILIFLEGILWYRK